MPWSDANVQTMRSVQVRDAESGAVEVLDAVTLSVSDTVADLRKRLAESDVRCTNGALFKVNSRFPGHGVPIHTMQDHKCALDFFRDASDLIVVEPASQNRSSD